MMLSKDRYINGETHSGATALKERSDAVPRSGNGATTAQLHDCKTAG
jgi:hypothetical protein